MEMNLKIKAMIHSLKDLAEVEIIEKRGDNEYIAKYEGERYTAIFNIFTCLYYVDDVYGELAPWE